MKVLIWAAALMALGAVGACSSGSGMTGSVFASSAGSGSSGHGGAGGGGTTFSTSTSTANSGSGAGGADCASGMPDHQTCVTCEDGKRPTGAMLYKALDDCIYCTECYTVCDGNAHGCPKPPAMKGACDGAAPDKMICGNTCTPCANMGACKATFNACIANQECLDYGTAILKCPP